MQRSIFDKKNIVLLLYLTFYVIYSSLATIYLFLPPLFSLLLFFFLLALKENNPFALFCIAAALLVFESNNGYVFFSTIIYFYLLHKIVMPKIYTYFSCTQCIWVAYPLLAYLGYFVFWSFIASIFLLPSPHINYYIIYYIVIEFFIVSLL